MISFEPLPSQRCVGRRRRALAPARGAGRSRCRPDSGAGSAAPSAIAASAFGDGPSGFSFEASLIEPVMPYSRSSSSIGLPGGYGVERSGSSSGTRCLTSMASPCAPPASAAGIRAQHLEPSSARRCERRERPLHARLVAGARAGRGRSTYSQGRPRSGRDSILLRLTPWVRERRAARLTSDARPRRARCSTSDVLSSPVGSPRRVVAEHEEAGHVVGLVLDARRRRHVEADSAPPRPPPRSPPCAARAGGPLGGDGVARLLRELGTPGRVRRQPAAGTAPAPAGARRRGARAAGSSRAARAGSGRRGTRPRR